MFDQYGVVGLRLVAHVKKMNEVESLKNKIKQLEKENDYLKSLLTKAGISFESETIVDRVGTYGPDQGSRIVPKTDFSEEDANQFFKMFWGRTDVYSKDHCADE